MIELMKEEICGAIMIVLDIKTKIYSYLTDDNNEKEIKMHQEECHKRKT